MLDEEVNINRCDFCQILKKCLSLSNLSRYQKTAKTKTAVSKIDTVPNSMMGMTFMFEHAFLTALPCSEQQLSTKSLMDIVPFLLKIPREICPCVVRLQCPCSQRVSKAILNVLNVIETKNACWSLHTLDTPIFELVVGHVSAVRTRLATNEDEAVAVVCCER